MSEAQMILLGTQHISVWEDLLWRDVYLIAEELMQVPEELLRRHAFGIRHT